ncbi:Uncharacterised protein [Mycobacteroides abscessus subsp. abscessus]|nr:Uncharacterised protein [Mycobacteroides abscessus subsp. abscessus]SKT80476.1 Uncharacterised protein [Mycobacteroides abscessus subsp. abscessus]SKX60056.1 Uncharacterised protein [Mycobacteroides abscessus subsp. abscessus]
MRRAEGARGAGSWVFPQVSGVEVGESWEEKGQVEGGFVWPGGCRERRAVAQPRCGGSIGGCWVAYGLGSRVAERRSGKGEMGLWGVLRRALRGGSGAGARVVLGRSWKGFASWAYRGGAHPKSRGSGILRSTLRPVLRGIFRAALRNRGSEGQTAVRTQRQETVSRQRLALLVLSTPCWLTRSPRS